MLNNPLNESFKLINILEGVLQVIAWIYLHLPRNFTISICNITLESILDDVPNKLLTLINMFEGLYKW